MSLRILGRGIGLALMVGSLLTAPARAYQITYDITGQFDYNGGVTTVDGTSVNGGTATISFAGVTGGFVVAPPAQFKDFGTFTASSTGSGGDFSYLDGLGFTLTITQTDPSPTGGSPSVFHSSIHGTVVSAGQSGMYIQFNQPLAKLISFSGGQVEYKIISADQQTDGRVAIRAPGSGGSSQSSTISGQINAVPEPSTVAAVLSGMPLLGLVWLRRRKRTV